MPTTLAKILSAAVLLPVLLFSAVGTSFALWRCRFDGVARTQCCCPKDAHAAEPAQAVATVSDLRCCEIEQHQVDRAPTEVSRGSASLVAMVALVALPTDLPPAVDPRVERGFAPPPAPPDPLGGRALVVQKQAFLI
jgi:hypothetical protein